MRYMVMLSMKSDVGPPPPALMEAMDVAMGEAFASGLMIDAGGLMGDQATTFTLRSGALSQTDGPYAEAKEVVGGYAVLEVRSHEEAVEGARRMMQVHLDHWPGWEGAAEVRRISEPSGGPAAAVTTSPTHEAVVAVWQLESGRVVAGLARMTRDLQLAEDLAQDALVAALESWPADGIPAKPGAWLMTVAKRRAIDTFRRAERHRQEVARIGHDLSETTMDDLVDQVDHVEDDVLRLMFLTCHPALTAESRAALTLRLVGGLTTEEIARGFQVKDTAVGQRISRAKKTLAEAGATLDMPVGEERTARLDDVMAVIYLVFNEGYAATAGTSWMRTDLCLEALRLARMLAALAPDDAEVHGLQALMELQASRFHARTSPSGEPVLLEDQDRARWDHLLIRRGLAALSRAEGSGQSVGVYTVQAAIAACHARARRAAGHGLDPDRRALRPAVLGRRQPRRRGEPRRRARSGVRPGRRARGPGRGRRRRGYVVHVARRPRRPALPCRPPRRGLRAVPHRRLPHPQRRRARPPPSAGGFGIVRRSVRRAGRGAEAEGLGGDGEAVELGAGTPPAGGRRAVRRRGRRRPPRPPAPHRGRRPRRAARRAPVAYSVTGSRVSMPMPHSVVAAAGVDLGALDVQAVEPQVAVAGELLDAEGARRPCRAGRRRGGSRPRGRPRAPRRPVPVR